MREHVQNIVAAIRRGHRFATYDIWHIGKPGEEVPDGFIIKQIRVGILLISNLWQGTVMLRASALTFATILAIVPSLAIMFYVIQTFELDEAIFETAKTRVEKFVEGAADFVHPVSEPELSDVETDSDLAAETPPEEITDEDLLPPGPEENHESITPSEPVDSGAETTATNDPTRIAPALAGGASNSDQSLKGLIRQMLFPDTTDTGEGHVDPVQELFDMASNLSDKAAQDPSGLLVAGVVLFFTTVLGLMRNIEKAFNHIWGVRRTRPWFRMVGDYLLITILLPFAAALVMGVTAALQTETVQERLGPLATLVQGTQFLLICSMFTALYVVVPNTRVRFLYGAVGGLVAGTAWVMLSWGFVQFQFGLARYSLVYSTFAQFPMLLLWIYMSWTILLFGAELTFAYQNEKTFAMERYSEDASYAYREALALLAMLDVSQRFEAGQPGLAPGPAARRLNVPTRLLNDVMEDLEKAGMIIACATDPVTYQPARALTRIRTDEIVKAIREVGREPSLLREDERVKTLMEQIATNNVDGEPPSLAELVKRMPAPEDDEAIEGKTGMIPFTMRETRERRTR